MHLQIKIEGRNSKHGNKVSSPPSVKGGKEILKILAPYIDFEGAKNTHFLKVLIWGFGGCWRFLTGVWHLDLDLDMVTGL